MNLFEVDHFQLGIQIPEPAIGLAWLFIAVFALCRREFRGSQPYSHTKESCDEEYPKPDERPVVNMLQWAQYQLDRCRGIASLKCGEVTFPGGRAWEFQPPSD